MKTKFSADGEERRQCGPGPVESQKISWKSQVLNEWDLDRRTEEEHSKYREGWGDGKEILRSLEVGS